MQKNITNRIVISAESIANGGAERVAVTLANKLSERFDAAILPFDDTTYYTVEPKVSIIGKRKRILFSKLLDFVSCILFALMRTGKNDVIISNMIRPNLIFCIIKVIRGGNVVCVHHSSFRRIKSRFLKFFVKLLYAQATKVVCISQDMLSDYENIFKNRNGVLIHNPHEIDKINILSMESVTDFTFKPENNYFCMVGRVLGLKRITDFLEAISTMPENIHGLIIGTGSDSDLGNLNVMIKKLDLSSRVFLLGAKKNPFPYIKKCTACVLCSETEGFPNILVESISLGIPVISSDCISGPRELINPDSSKDIPKGEVISGDNGLLFNIGDVEGLKCAITRIISGNNFKSEELQKNSMIYNVDAIIKKYEDLVFAIDAKC